MVEDDDGLMDEIEGYMYGQQQGHLQQSSLAASAQSPTHHYFYDEDEDNDHHVERAIVRQQKEKSIGVDGHRQQRQEGFSLESMTVWNWSSTTTTATTDRLPSSSSSP